MRIVNYYSHLNGYEHIHHHKKYLWDEIEAVIQGIDASMFKTKVSGEKGRVGEILYNPDELHIQFKKDLGKRGWKESRTSYWVTADHNRKTMAMSAKDQREEIEAANAEAIFSYNQNDFVKDRIEIEVQFGKYFSVAYDLFVKHMAFFVGDVIDVGIEILPMKEMQRQMSSGPPYYEGELYNLLRQGRSTPAVPLVIVGIAE